MFGTQTISWNSSPTASAAPAAAPPVRNRVREVISSMRVKARYDNALTTDENIKQWGYVDFLSPKAANSREVRRVLRMRARYCIQNNPLAAGVVGTLAKDIVGKGPRLQVLFPNPKLNEAIEAAWRRWFLATNLGPRLRVAVAAKFGDGEAIFLKKTRRDQADAVKVYHLDVETEQMQTIDPKFRSGYWVDGIELDELGLPVSYHILKRHPGDLSTMGLGYTPLTNVRVPRRYVIHWFRRYRPGQVRGIPELTPSLGLFEQLRRFDHATLTAAEWAAVMSAVLETELGADDDTAMMGAPWEEWTPDAGTVSTLPAGYKLNQMKPNQPSTTHKEFTGTLIGHAARPVDMPFNIATCNSSGYNFSSGRLDHLPYYRSIDIERQDMEEVVLDPMASDWLDEAISVPNYFGAEFDGQVPALLDQIPHLWHWPPMDDIDPSKTALADAQNLANGTECRSDICSRNGREYRQIRRRQAEEIAYDRELATELGLPENWADGLRPNMPTPTEAEDEAPAGKEKVAA